MNAECTFPALGALGWLAGPPAPPRHLPQAGHGQPAKRSRAARPPSAVDRPPSTVRRRPSAVDRLLTANRPSGSVTRMPRLGLPRRLQSFASPSTTASPTVSSSTPPASAALSSAVSPSSRSNSAKQLAMEPKSTASLALRVTVVKVATPPARLQKLTALLQGRNLAAKDRGGTSDPVCLLPTGCQKGRLADAPVPRPHARRRQAGDARHQQDAEPRMEPDARPAHRRRAEPAARGLLLGQGPLRQGLHG